MTLTCFTGKSHCGNLRSMVWGTSGCAWLSGEHQSYMGRSCVSSHPSHCSGSSLCLIYLTHSLGCLYVKELFFSNINLMNLYLVSNCQYRLLWKAVNGRPVYRMPWCLCGFALHTSFPYNSRATECLLSVSTWFNNEVLEWAGVEKDGKTNISPANRKGGKSIERTS